MEVNRCGDRINVAFVGHSDKIRSVYSPAARERIARLANVVAGVIPGDDINERLKDLESVDIIFSTWGMPNLSVPQLERLPRLKAVFYGAGSVQYFARPLLERAIIVVSAWCANALPVAEFTLSQILLSGKGYFRNLREFNGLSSQYHAAFAGPGNYGETLALLGAGAVGRALIEMLRSFHWKVILFDPFVSEEQAAGLGVEKVTLSEAFERGLVVSNHLADKPETEGILNGELFDRLRPGATFINTGRGRTVVESELAEVFSRRVDLTALLDVTHPEPVAPESSIMRMSNVLLTTHIAGSMGNELGRLADTCISEFERYLRGEPLQYSVTIDALAMLT